MTQIKNNALLKGLRGKMGETHSYRKIRGKMYMVNLPEDGRPVGPAQQLVVNRFKKAVNYAKARMLQPDMLALYQTGITSKKINAYLVAVSDSLNAPKVNEIKTGDYDGQAGNFIRIDATDDFKVVRVRVTITDASGARVEKGEATQDPTNSHLWVYTTTAPNPVLTGTKISATAFDLADNETTLEVTL